MQVALGRGTRLRGCWRRHAGHPAPRS
jgi:hypothetical protein